MLEHKVYCADCGALMVLRTTKKFQYGDGNNRNFYGCSNYPICKGTHGAHPDGRPLGTPATAEVKQLRRAAHAAIEAWAARNDMSIRRAHQRLNDHFGCDVHMGELDGDGCQKVINFVS